ncbi:MAG: FxsA family protein [Planctomycetes bacterium]|nr:FxsA family protein [Planctomycetota bacterium]
MLFRLFLVIVVLPLAELAVLFAIAEHTSWWFVLGLVAFTGVFGAALARREGLRCWQAIQDEMRQGRLPAQGLLEGVLILLAGVVLITPGAITDVLGFALLTPAFRRRAIDYLVHYLRDNLVPPPVPDDWDTPTRPRDEIIDAHVVDPQHRSDDDPE